MADNIKLDATRMLAALQEGQRRAANLRPAYEVIGNDFVVSAQENFDSGGRPRWARLMKSTIAQKVRIGKNNGPLKRSNRMRNAVHYRAGQTFVRWGTTVRYAVFHQKGKDRMHRDFLTPQPEDMDEAADTVLEHLAEPFA